MANQKSKFPTKYIAFTTYFSSSHQAVDIPNGVTANGKMNDNKNVYFTHDGKVITNSYASDYGYFIEYEYYEDGVRYVVGDGHFNSRPNLNVGQTYKQGTFINTMGNTGTSSATHDHHRLSRNGNRVDPLKYEYVYPDQVVGTYETAKLMYYTPTPEKHYIKYRAHIETTGWQGWKYEGQVAGTTGKGKRLEAIQIDTTGTLLERTEIYAKAHIQKDGWKDYGKINKNTIIGTTGQGKRLECLCLKGKFDYRVHLQGTGWTCWTYADGICTLGSVGQALRIEAIEIRKHK